MHYIVSFEATSLLFLLIVTIKFFQSRHFPSRLNKIFGIIMVCGIADIFLDIVSSYVIEFSAYMPVWGVYLINSVFYLMQTAFPVVLAWYVIVMVGRTRYNLKIILLLLPAFLCATAGLLANPFTGYIFYIDVNGNFQHGDFFYFLYLVTAFYLLLTFYSVNLNKTPIRLDERKTINSFLLIIIASIIIQYFYPAYLLTGVAIAIAIIMMYFTLENPDGLIDVNTGAFNYAAFLSFISETSKDKRSYNIIALEVNGMRQLNNVFGLELGNGVLKSVCGYLNGMYKDSWVFRLMGTRFVIITFSEEHYRNIVDLIKKRFSEPWVIGSSDVVLGAAVRYFSVEKEYKSAENIVDLIDEVFNDISEEGYSAEAVEESLLDKIDRKLRVETALRSGLEKKEGFYLVYQPIISLKENRFVTAEALLRFEDKELGNISPGEFIPIAEKCGLILLIDEMVVNFACDFIKRVDPLNNLNLNALSVNLSAAEFLTKSFPKRLTSIVEASLVDPNFINFEITETAAGAAGNILKKYMLEMKKQGYTFSMDDFGTGYSNMTQIVNMPFTTVKLDRSLLIAHEDDGEPGILFETLLRTFQLIGYKTIVEGVETIKQLECVRNIEGADFIQGYYFAQPMKENDFILFMTEQKHKNLREQCSCDDLNL